MNTTSLATPTAPPASGGADDFMHRIDAALRLHERQRTGFALLLIAPPANAAAPEVLSAINASVRHSDTAVMFHAQQFGVLLSMGNEGGAQRVASKIIESMAAALSLDESRLGDVAIGIALAPAHGKSREQLMRAADAALYQARRNRRGIVMAVAGEAGQAPALDQHIHSALAQNEFVLRFQPVVELATSRLHFAEALVRWHHPALGLLPPAEFLHIIERDAKADAVALQLIDSAIEQIRAWRNEGLNTPVSINLGVPTLALDSLEQAIAGRMHALSLPGESLMIEIRDDNLAQLPPGATKNLFALAATGVQICLDDFGSGTASLAALRDLPVSEFKIAAQFVSPLCRSQADAAIVGALIELGRRMGKRVVAKGVEDRATRNALSELGCPYAQGFEFAQALDALVLAGWQAAQS